jgi:general secretion pathway protein H
MKSTSDGFTLLEMIVTLALMSLALAVVLPVVTSRNGTSLDATAAEIAGVIRLSRSKAIAQNQTQSLFINLAQRTISDGRRVELLQIDPAYGIVASFGRETGNAGEPSYRFFADGQTTGGKVEISKDGQRRVVAINWVTGAVTVGTP